MYTYVDRIESRTDRGEHKRVRVYVEYIQGGLHIPWRIVTLNCAGISVRTYIRACRNVEMGEEYFITIQQIMLNVLRFPRVRGGVRYYGGYLPNAHHATNYMSLDIESQENALVFLYMVSQNCHHTPHLEIF